MSKTTPEVITILYNYLKTSPLMLDANKPDGVLSKFNRPENSINEDVVINLIGGLTRDPVQRGILVVNIFTKNLDPARYNHLQGDATQPDTLRLTYLSKLFQQSIQGMVWEDSGDYSFEIQQDGVDADQNNQHYAWFRVEFYSINI